jgi:hypothetical protein
MDSRERDPKLDKHLDEWLDDALAGYSKADPRPGLEQRITANLRAEDRAPARRRWWMFLTPAAAGLAVLAITVSLHQTQRSQPAPQGATVKTEIAKNEPEARLSVPETDSPVTPARTRQPAAKPKETQSSADAEFYVALPDQTKQIRIAPATPPPVKAVHNGAVVGMVAEAKPETPQLGRQLGGTIVGNIERKDALQASGAAAPAPPQQAQVAKSEAEPSAPGRSFEAAPQIAATMTRPAATFKKQAAEQTVEVSGNTTALDTRALERSNTLAAAQAKSLNKAKLSDEANFYKLDFVLRELEDGKVVNVRNYSVMARSGEWQQLRVSNSVPTTTESKKADKTEAIGLSMNCRIIPGADGTAMLDTKADISSMADRGTMFASNPAPPVRHVQMNSSAPVTLGKPILLSGVDELSSKRRFELEVTVTKAK